MLHVLDPAEIEFPFDEATRFVGLEGESPLLTEPRALRKAYVRQLEDFTRRLQEGCRARQIDYARMPTDRAVDVAVGEVLGRRG